MSTASNCIVIDDSSIDSEESNHQEEEEQETGEQQDVARQEDIEVISIPSSSGSESHANQGGSVRNGNNRSDNNLARSEPSVRRNGEENLEEDSGSRSSVDDSPSEKDNDGTDSAVGSDGEDESHSSSQGTSQDESYAQSEPSGNKVRIPHLRIIRPARKHVRLPPRPPTGDVIEILSSDEASSEQGGQDEDEQGAHTAKSKEEDSTENSDDESMEDLDRKMPARSPSYKCNDQRRAIRRRPSRHIRSLSGGRIKQMCPICLKSFPGDMIEDHASTCGLKGGHKADAKPPGRNKKILPNSIEFSTSPRPGESNKAERSHLSEDPFVGGNSSRSQKHDFSDTHGSPASGMERTAKRKRTDDADDTVDKFGCQPGKRQFETYSCDLESSRPASWKEEVKDALRKVRHDNKERKMQLLKQTLDRNMRVLRSQNKLVYHGQNHGNRVKFDGGVDQHQELDSTSELAEDFPLPRDNTSTIFLRTLFHSSEESVDESSSSSNDAIDETSLQDGDTAIEKTRKSIHSSCPGDEDDFHVGANYYADDETCEFNDSEKVGAGYEDIEIDHDIETVLKMLQDGDHDVEELRSYLEYLLRTNDRDRKAKKTEKTDKTANSAYENAMSSFREMFCRRCCIYDCHLHGLAEYQDPDLQAELALQREIDGYWTDAFVCLPTAGSSGSNPICPPSVRTVDPMGTSLCRSMHPYTSTNPTKLQIILCKKLCRIFQGDVTKISRASGLSANIIATRFSSEIRKFRSVDLNSINDKQRGSQRSNPRPSWLNRRTKAKQRKFYFPCFHKEPCSKETCTCIQNRYFCTKHCIWGATSRNYFKGCRCTSTCSKQSCPCKASDRECDPDLCRSCGTCSDPPNQPVTKQRCRNDAIGMRRHTHLLVAKSLLEGAGWGLFNKYPLKKGEYIHEYLGEVISQDEADERGAVYDERNQNYLFQLTEDYEVDAWRRGNKTRFMNHSHTPNVMQKLHMVNGDFRIGFFAKVDIPAQTELFFDYGGTFFSRTGNFFDKGRLKNEDRPTKRKKSKKRSISKKKSSSTKS